MLSKAASSRLLNAFRSASPQAGPAATALPPRFTDGPSRVCASEALMEPIGRVAFSTSSKP